MGVMRVIDLKRVIQTGFEIWGGTAIASLQQPTGQDTKPQLHLGEPRAMFRRQVEHRLMVRIAQEGTPLSPAAPVLGHTGYVAPLGDETADRQAPVGMESIHHPVIALHSWEWLDHMGQMGGTIGTGARLTQMPHDVPCGDDKRR
jgi:hypothetical protein